MGKDQTITPGTLCPTLYDECVGSLTSLANHNSDDAGDGAYSLSSLSQKTRISNHLKMSLQRQHILLSYFKTLSGSPQLFQVPEFLYSVSLNKNSLQLFCTYFVQISVKILL